MYDHLLAGTVADGQGNRVRARRKAVGRGMPGAGHPIAESPIPGEGLGAADDGAGESDNIASIRLKRLPDEAGANHRVLNIQRDGHLDYWVILVVGGEVQRGGIFACIQAGRVEGNVDQAAIARLDRPVGWIF
jgi:hypothetical protein